MIVDVNRFWEKRPFNIMAQRKKIAVSYGIHFYFFMVHRCTHADKHNRYSVIGIEAGFRHISDKKKKKTLSS